MGRLQTMRHACPYIGRCLILLVMLAHESRGVEVSFHGLNIENILSPNVSASGTTTPADETHLDVMLQHCTFPASIVDEQVAVSLTENITEYSDTDESIEKDQEGSTIYFKKFTSKTSGDRSKILLKPSEINKNQTPAEITEDLCRKLAKDAFRIANAHHNARTRESTTCLCVVLRDSKKDPKRLIFHNSTGEMQLSMRKKANDMEYGIRNAHLAHAEAQFIDFLRCRAQQHAYDKTKIKYTHILGMGCSRKHCQECNALCKLFLGNNYPVCTAAMEQLTINQDIPRIEDCTQDDEADLQITIPEQKFKVVFREDAVREGNNRSANYRLSESMQKAICDKSGLTDIDFSGIARFNCIGHASMLTEDEGMEIVGEYATEETEEAINTTMGKKRKASSSP